MAGADPKLFDDMPVIDIGGGALEDLEDFLAEDSGAQQPEAPVHEIDLKGDLDFDSLLKSSLEDAARYTRDVEEGDPEWLTQSFDQAPELEPASEVAKAVAPEPAAEPSPGKSAQSPNDLPRHPAARNRKKGKPKGNTVQPPARTPMPPKESEVVGQLRGQVEKFRKETEAYRKRVAAEAEGARSMGREDVFQRLFPIIDTLEIALQAAGDTQDAQQLIDGIRMVIKQLLDEFKPLGLESIKPDGERFDPNAHEALQRVNSGQAEPGTIVRVVRRGYRLDKRLLRPAQVYVEGGE